MREQDKIFIDFINERKEWTGALGLNKRDLSICYYLLRTHKASKCNDLYDLMTIYDNLVINSEILDDYTIGDFDDNTIQELTNLKADTARQKVANGVIWLFDFYDARGHHETKLKLNVNYNDIEEHASNELKEIVRGLR